MRYTITLYERDRIVDHFNEELKAAKLVKEQGDKWNKEIDNEIKELEALIKKFDHNPFEPKE